MKKTIVLVDDNEEFLDACADTLKKVGFEVASFANVDDAKKFLNGSKELSSIYAIISDLIMGPVDGLEFLAYIKTSPALKHIDFFILTGTTIELFEPYYSCYAVKGIIEKPCSPKKLIEKVVDLNMEKLAS